MNLIKLLRNLPPDTSELLIGLLFSVPAAWMVGAQFGGSAGAATWGVLYLLALIWQAVRRLIVVLTIAQTMELRNQMTALQLERMQAALDQMTATTTAKDRPTP